MSLDKPISSIRKAVEEKAEMSANKEFYEKPQPKHYKEAFEMFRQVKKLSPDMFEKFIELLAETRDIKTKMGPELFSVYKSVTDRIIGKQQEKISRAIDKITEDSDILDKMNEVSAMLTRALDSINTEIKTDPEIVTAFAGKENMVDDALIMMKKLTPSVLNSFAKAALEDDVYK